MKKIVLASNNVHKVKEIKSMLDNYEIITLNEIGYNDEIEETGTTYLENALIKARTISKYLKEKNLEYDVLADDSGLSCVALNLEPGVYSARYAGVHGDNENHRKKLIENLKGKDNTAYYICTLVLYHMDGTYEYAEGKTYGKIIDKEVGSKDFCYDCIFLSDDLGKTFGEATDEEKNSVSHRYRALKQMKELIK
jgi:XTP/dITP diphosphohydrolase